MCFVSRLLHFNDVEPMDVAEAEEPIPVPTKERHEKDSKKRKRESNKKQNDNQASESQFDLEKSDPSRAATDSNSSQSRSESPSDYMVDYKNLIPNIATDGGETSVASGSRKLLVTKISSEHASKVVKVKGITNNTGKDSVSGAVQRLGTNPSISVRQLFPGEEELGLEANIDFGNALEHSPHGWEKCLSTIQYNSITRQLWDELQRPYGSQSSFLRHLILLEKYFRSGDLVLSPNASNHSINYSEHVQNRLRAYDNVPNPVSSYVTTPTASNSPQVTVSVTKSSSGIITTNDHSPTMPVVNAANIPKNIPLTLSQLNQLVPNYSKAKSIGAPPGLISLQPGTSKAVTTPPSAPKPPQKIKIPVTKNWRPNLIPIDPNNVNGKKPGHVKVISSGVPYYITLDDYNRMCAIKKSFDLKQKRLAEATSLIAPGLRAQGLGKPTVVTSILKKSMPHKTLVISKDAVVVKNQQTHLIPRQGESSLEKLDKAVEQLESKLSKPQMSMPKIPKSLTVIPQTVTRKHPQGTPVFVVTSTPKSTVSRS